VNGQLAVAESIEWVWRNALERRFTVTMEMPERLADLPLMDRKTDRSPASPGRSTGAVVQFTE